MLAYSLVFLGGVIGGWAFIIGNTPNLVWNPILATLRLLLLQLRFLG